MSGKNSPANVNRSPALVPVEPIVLQALFDTLKENHCRLKAEAKTLFKRCNQTGELSTIKAMLLEYPPLHCLNELLDDVLESPVRVPRVGSSGHRSVTPQSTRASKKRSAEQGYVAASKALKFSPHLFKKEPASTAGASPTADFEALLGEDGEEKENEDDDVVEIQCL